MTKFTITYDDTAPPRIAFTVFADHTASPRIAFTVAETITLDALVAACQEYMDRQCARVVYDASSVED